GRRATALQTCALPISAHGHTRGTQAPASPALRLARVSEKIVHLRDAGGDQGLRARASAPGVVTGLEGDVCGGTSGTRTGGLQRTIGRASCRGRAAPSA